MLVFRYQPIKSHAHRPPRWFVVDTTTGTTIRHHTSQQARWFRTPEGASRYAQQLNLGNVRPSGSRA